MRRHAVAGVVVMVVKAGAPVGRRLAAHYGHERAPVESLGRLRTRHLHKGRGVINVLHERREAAAGLDHAGPLHNERHVQRLLVNPALVEPAVLSVVEALVGRVDDHGVFLQTLRFQILDHAAEAVVHRLDAAEIVLHIFLVLPARKFPPGQMGVRERLVARAKDSLPFREFRVRHALHLAGAFSRFKHFQVAGQIHLAGDFHFLHVRRGSPTGVVVEKRLRLRHLHVGQPFVIARRRHPVPMRCLVLHHEQEGLRLVPLPQPVEAHVRDDVRGVALALLLSVGADKIGVPVFTLADQQPPVVGPGGRAAEMPLADHRRLIARLAQGGGEGPQSVANRLAQRHHAVGMRVQSGEDRGAARRAK